ncbi:hypothetical protein U9M48_025640 [Paspalum notatum var. saurae]|uniref:Uncharacterized protein n=1 Tax=Paspalum notatum var. saurae TaxID=547442 RepID=A0AAQ3TP67_PASNO
MVRTHAIGFCCVYLHSGLLPLFLRAVARLAACVAARPVSATAATVLYHAGALPRDPALERLVCDDMTMMLAGGDQQGGAGDDCILLQFVVGVMSSAQQKLSASAVGTASCGNRHMYT